MAKSDPRLPNGKRDNMKANQPSAPKQAPMDVTSKKKATNAHEDARSPKPATKAPAKEAPKSNKPTTRPMPAPKGTASGMGGKVAKGSKNPIRKLVSRVKRGR
jgi:hypothetical protein